MADLATRYLNLDLDNPIVVAASGLTGSLEGIERCAEAGAGAVVLKSMFEELIDAGSTAVSEQLDAASHPEAADYRRADLGMRLGPLPYLELIEQARERVSIPIIASINCATPGWWVSYARSLESVGADAVELNISHFPRFDATPSEEIERRYADIVRRVADELTIPVAVKLGASLTTLPRVMAEVVSAGACGLVLFNRYCSLDVDLDLRSFRSELNLSEPSDLHLPLRWIALAAANLDCDLAASTGVHTCDAVVKLLLAGATVTQVCSVLYRRGPSYLGELRDGLSRWLDGEGFGGVSEIRGLALADGGKGDPGLTRLQYVAALESASAFYRF